MELHVVADLEGMNVLVSDLKSSVVYQGLSYSEKTMNPLREELQKVKQERDLYAAECGRLKNELQRQSTRAESNRQSLGFDPMFSPRDLQSELSRVLELQVFDQMARVGMISSADLAKVTRAEDPPKELKEERAVGRFGSIEIDEEEK